MPAPASTRVLWKGAISFGLVHIPVALHSAVQNQSIDFDWLDRRSMEPVGYKRINKVTGKEIDRADIVKGIEYDEGEYVILEAEEISAAYPRTTQTVEIEAFVSLDDVPFVYLERPYYVAPINKGGKVYALLREVLAESRLAGLAKVVIQTKQHLALLFACGPVLILNLLRWGGEVRDWSALKLPGRNKKELGLSEKELDMARQLVGDMTVAWQPEHYTDSFREQVMQLVQEKIEAGDTAEVLRPEPEESEPGSARIYDLTEMLQRSLKGVKAAPASKKPAKKAAARPAGKTAAKSAAKSAARSTKSAAKAAAKKAASTKRGANRKKQAA
ncbi:Ku protein [Alcaligenaceae bacterium]|nr:Ku protein [Alcaligenaceae bacterium]